MFSDLQLWPLSSFVGLVHRLYSSFFSLCCFRSYICDPYFFFSYQGFCFSIMVSSRVNLAVTLFCFLCCYRCFNYNFILFSFLLRFIVAQSWLILFFVVILFVVIVPSSFPFFFFLLTFMLPNPTLLSFWCFDTLSSFWIDLFYFYFFPPIMFFFQFSIRMMYTFENNAGGLHYSMQARLISYDLPKFFIF